MPTLFESASVKVKDHRPFGSDILVVSFSERSSQTQGLDRPGFGQAFLRNAGLDGMFVTCIQNDWYQYPEMKDAIESIGRHTAGKTVVTYGSSMGAYAALRFAASLGATRAVAISPQYTVDRTRMPDEDRWAADSRRITFLDDDVGRDLTGQTTPYVLVDPVDRDMAHARRLQSAIPHIQIVRVPFGCHPVGPFLRQTGLLAKVMLNLIMGQHHNATWCAERRSARHLSHLYWTGMAETAKRLRHDKVAHYALSRSKELPSD